MSVYRSAVRGVSFSAAGFVISAVVFAALGEDATMCARAGLGLAGLALILYMFEPIE